MKALSHGSVFLDDEVNEKLLNMENPYDAEFLDPNRNYEVTMQELRNRIENLRLDSIQANDPEVKGFAEKRYIELRIE